MICKDSSHTLESNSNTFMELPMNNFDFFQGQFSFNIISLWLEYSAMFKEIMWGFFPGIYCQSSTKNNWSKSLCQAQHSLYNRAYYKIVSDRSVFLKSVQLTPCELETSLALSVCHGHTNSPTARHLHKSVPIYPLHIYMFISPNQAYLQSEVTGTTKVSNL